MSPNPGAMFSARPDPGRFETRTMGRDGSSIAAASSTSMTAASRTASRPSTPRMGNITASGLTGRCFRTRNFSMAVALRESTIRWYPPMPFTATIFPACSSRTAALISASGPLISAEPPFSNSRPGPHSGQAIGSAWKRRSVGSSYSARQSPQSSKPAMLVFGRS